MPLLKKLKDRHATGQPVLVGTIAVETTELLSTMLTKKNVFHMRY